MGVLCTIAGCGRSVPPEMTKGFGGADNLRLIREATKVEVFRVASPLGRHEFPANAPTAAGFPVLAGPVLLDADPASRLIKSVTDPATYQFEMFSACIFDPGYVARFTRGNDAIELAFCFQCNEILVTHGGRTLNMIPGRDRLLDQLRPLFPADDAAALTPAESH